MNIGFYGHSSASAYKFEKKSFIDYVELALNCNIVNTGVPQGSEERILFDLKKTKNLDIAVIFHSTPKYVFLPKCKRDISIKVIPERKSKIFWNEDVTDPKSQIDKIDVDDFFNNSGVKEVFGDESNFVDCMRNYKDYLTDKNHVLLDNRYESTKLMIDTWCLAKCPKVVHIDSYKEMNWFTFKSGILSQEISEIITKNPSRESMNRISGLGNRLIAQKLIDIFKENNYI